MPALGNIKEPKRALVLGGGGPVGLAWQAGLVSGLVAMRIALDQADTIIGTSAGAIVGAELALGLDLKLGSQLQASTAPLSANGMAALIRASAEALTAPVPEPSRQRIGAFALQAETPDEEQAMRRVDRLADRPWPASLRATAVNVRTGASVVWDNKSGVPLNRAVASSCALPGVWPPITINDARYMDGGIRSMLNADLASGHDIVVVISCFPLSLPEDFKNDDQRALNARLHSEITSLQEAGARVVVIEPSKALMLLTQGGSRMLDVSLAPEAFKIGAQQAAEAINYVQPVWW